MDNKIIENIIYKILNLKGLTHENRSAESISRSIMEIVFEEMRTVISNAVILWNNHDYSTENQIIEEEFYPSIFNYDSLFKKESIVNLTECIYPVEGYKLIKNESFKRDIYLWNSVCVMPLFNKQTNSSAVIVFLSSHNFIPFSNEQIDILRLFLNEIFDSKTSFLKNDILRFIEHLSDFTKTAREDKTLSDKYDNLSDALKMYNGNIVHFSIWKINNINNEDFKVIKEKNQNLKDEINFEKYQSNDKQNYLLKYDDEHRLIRYINSLRKSEILNKDYEDLSDFIKIDLFKDEDTFNSCYTKEYCKQIGIIIDKTVVVYIPIIPLHHNKKRDSVNILCLYINKLHYTVFRNLSVLSILSRKIYESLTLYNQLIRNDTTNKILEIQENDESKFFNEVAKILKQKNECKSCYIYLKEEMTDDCLKMIVGIEDDNFINVQELTDNTEITLDNKNSISLQLTNELFVNENFLTFINNIRINQEIDIQEVNGNKETSNEDQNDYFLYYGNYPQCANEKVYSAILIPIREKEKTKKKFVGFILFVNKNVSKYGHIDQKYSPYFSVHNKLIVSPSLDSIYRYKLLKDATKKSELVLGRIRHEIPREVNLITQNIEIIKEFFNIEKSKYAHLINVTNYTALSGKRIELFTNLATLIGFTKQEILKQKILEKQSTFDIIKHINSMKDIFRAEVKEYGIDIIFEENYNKMLLNASRFYQFAINNIIFNAIRYSLFGSCVNVQINNDSVAIVNYGIEIKNEDKEKIFKEGYRGNEAKEFTKDGMGLGLFLAKEVITAHSNHTIISNSEIYYKQNYFGIQMLFDFIDKQEKDGNFGYGLSLYNNQLEEEDKFTVSEFNKNRNQWEDKIPLDLKRKSFDKFNVSNFIDAEFKGKKIFFETFEERYLKRPIFKTTFTIFFK